MPWCIWVSPRSLRNVCAARMAWCAASYSLHRADIKREEHERNNASACLIIIANMGDRSERGSAKHKRRTTISGEAAGAQAKRSGAAETLSGQVKEKEPRHETSASKQKNHSDAGDDMFRYLSMFWLHVCSICLSRWRERCLYTVSYIGLFIKHSISIFI